MSWQQLSAGKSGLCRFVVCSFLLFSNGFSARAQSSAAPQIAAQAAMPPATAPKKRTPILDPNRTPYPRSSLHDFSNLLEAPAGKRGFVSTQGDHFVYQDGTRARFWGINVANTSLQEPDKDIDQIIDNFRTAGFNLVRLHHFDERGGIIDLTANDSRHFVAARLKKLDYWIYKSKQAGISIYLDLLDYRHFKPGDGVVNPEGVGRAARPYAVFDPRLIELQKEYARKLLVDHVNPYTGLRYVDDPAIVMLELYDESGLFMRRGVWREMPEPYATRFKALWNGWLRQQYKTTPQLSAAWTDNEGRAGLASGESLENANVEVPVMTWTPEKLPANQQLYGRLARRSDGARFAHDLHRQYFRDMKTYLRKLGVKIPIAATGRFDDLADLRSESAELDFIGANFYYDHPYWGTGAPAWQPPSFFHNHNPMSHIDELSMAAAISLARVKGKPFVVREWNYCWPNRNRASGMVEAAAYASLHDIDAMILFVYETRPTARVSYFNVRSDPSRWGLCGVGAEIFLKGLIAPSRHKIVVPYGPVDTFTYLRYHQPFYALGWATRVENDFYDGEVYQARGDVSNTLLVSPGRSALGRFEGAPAVLHTESLRRDPAGRTVSIPQYLAEYALPAYKAGNVSLSYNGVLFDERAQRDRHLTLGLPLSPIRAAGLQPIGYNESAGVANGFVDAKARRFVFGDLEPNDVLRAALDAMQTFYGVPNSHDATEQNVFFTDTGEMMRDAASGRLVVSAPQFQALCGNLGGVGRVLAPGLRVRNMNSGTLVALALDGKPLTSSRKYLIKLVTDARNQDEKSGPDPRFAKTAGGQWKLEVLGEGPVTTFGRASSKPIQISIERRALVDVYLDRGSFELFVDGDEMQFYCDTPGVRFALHREPKADGTRPVNLKQIDVSGMSTTLVSRSSGGQEIASFPARAVLVRASD